MGPAVLGGMGPGDGFGAGHTNMTVINMAPSTSKPKMGQEGSPVDQTSGENRDFGRRAPSQVVPMTEPLLGTLGSRRPTLRFLN